MTRMNRLPGTVRQLIAALRGLIVFTIICGIAYPVIMFGVAQLAFHKQANGSLVSYQGKVVGSSLLCQEFVDSKGNPLPQYFQPRASVASNPAVKTDYGCDPLFSGASNLGPNNPTLVQDIKTRQQQIAAFDHVKVSQIRPGPLHLTAERGHPGGPGGSGQAHQPGRGPGAGQPEHPGPQYRVPRRASGQRAQPEYRARHEVPGLGLNQRPADD